MKNTAIIGSTGSIGTQTLEIARANDDLNIVALAAGKNIKLLEKQARSSDRRSSVYGARKMQQSLSRIFATQI